MFRCFWVIPKNGRLSSAAARCYSTTTLLRRRQRQRCVDSLWRHSQTKTPFTTATTTMRSTTLLLPHHDVKKTKDIHHNVMMMARMFSTTSDSSSSAMDNEHENKKTIFANDDITKPRASNPIEFQPKAFNYIQNKKSNQNSKDYTASPPTTTTTSPSPQLSQPTSNHYNNVHQKMSSSPPSQYQQRHDKERTTNMTQNSKQTIGHGEYYGKYQGRQDKKKKTFNHNMMMTMKDKPKHAQYQQYPPHQKNQQRQNPPHQKYQQHTHHNRDHHHHQEEANKVEQQTTFPTSHWIQIDNAPPLATLDDILSAVQRVLLIEYKIGMIPLDHHDEKEKKDNNDDDDDNAMTKTTTTATNVMSSSSSFESVVEKEEAIDSDDINPDTRDWITSAKVVLSYHARPSKWRIRLRDISMVHAFLEHFKQQQLQLEEEEKKELAMQQQQKDNTTVMLLMKNGITNRQRRPLMIWKETVISEWHDVEPKQDHDHDNSSSTAAAAAAGRTKQSTVMRKNDKKDDIGWYTDLQVSDHMIRVENCPPHMSPDHVRHLFRRYHLGAPSVYVWKEQLLSYTGTSSTATSQNDTTNTNSQGGGGGGDAKEPQEHKGMTTNTATSSSSTSLPHVYIVNFQDASWARAALRELQGLVIDHHELRMAQYPKQL